MINIDDMTLNVSPVVLIPVHHHSKRLPHKQEFLLPWTIDFLDEQGIWPGQIYTQGHQTEEQIEWLKTFSPYKHIQLTVEEDCDHLTATRNAVKKLKLDDRDIIVMLQPTQPARELNLLWKAVDTVYQNPDLSVVSYTEVRNGGRILNEDGTLKTDKENIKLYDGAVYAGTVNTFADWFDMSKPHNAVRNKELSVIDIDYFSDLTTHILWK